MIEGYSVLPSDEARLNREFTYHAPKGDQPKRYEEIRKKAKDLAELVCAYCPAGNEKEAALHYIGITVMEANAAIARGE